MNDINKFQTHFASCIAVRSLLKKSVLIDKFRLRIILCNTKIRTPTCLWYVPLKIGEVPKRVILAYLKTTLNYCRGTYGLMGTFTYYVEHYLHFGNGSHRYMPARQNISAKMGNIALSFSKIVESAVQGRQ